MPVGLPYDKALKELEDRLLQPEVRLSPDLVADLLDDEFVEYGSSGKVYNKQQIIEFLKTDILEPPSRNFITDFKANELAPGIVLVTFCLVRQMGLKDLTLHSLRSSVWKKQNGEWKMVFHQGTLI